MAFREDRSRDNHIDSDSDSTNNHHIVGDASINEENIPEMMIPPSIYSSSNFCSAEFMNILETSIHNVISNNNSGALILLSISNLSMIINAYGHDTSEIVIHDIIKMIDDILGEEDTIYRLQRDQIGIILSYSYPDDTSRMMARINSMVQNFGRDNFETASLYVMGILGSVSFPLETADASDALDKAYVTINSMQSSSQRTYESTRHEASQCRQQMGLANYFFNAIKEDRARLAYQPVVNAKDGSISHYEALLRIVDKTGKISSAGALIPVAEKMGLIDVVDTMVMGMVVDELRENNNVKLAFNVSNMTTENQVWLTEFERKVKQTPEIASRITVEITETAVQQDLRSTAFFVASLQDLGCHVALDDFGSGYTSFRQLKALSVDMVKIDGVFIKDLAESSDNRFFVKTLLEFAQGFGLKTVAEFVENGESAKILMDMGVDYLQGYYLGKPENHRSWLNGGEYKKS
ncbi:MAG: GGDEF domain-containing phosphodiesterase [Rickettsiales bacterium]